MKRLLKLLGLEKQEPKLTFAPWGIGFTRPKIWTERIRDGVSDFIRAGNLRIGKAWIGWRFPKWSAWNQIAMGFGSIRLSYAKLKRGWWQPDDNLAMRKWHRDE